MLHITMKPTETEILKVCRKKSFVLMRCGFGGEISNSIESYGVKLYLHYIGNDILSLRLQNSVDTKAEDKSEEDSKIQKVSVASQGWLCDLEL